MKISQILKDNEVTISFEVFPPKIDSNFDKVAHAAQEIAQLQPHFMSVTYGAGGSTNKNTLQISKHIQETTQTPVLAHLTCVSSTKEDIHTIVQNYKDNAH